MKYAFLGPESTGKSTLIYTLSKKNNGIVVDEVARDYLKEIGLNYSHEDILDIAMLQIEAEQKAESDFPDKTIFCDTELITIQIWLEYLNYEVPEWIITSIKTAEYKKYFLCDIDIPWVADDLRKNEHDRKEIMQLFIDKLEFNRKDYVIIKGQGDERIQNVLNYFY